MPTIWNYYENFFISFSFYDLVVNLKNHNSYPVRGLSKEIIKLGRGVDIRLLVSCLAC